MNNTVLEIKNLYVKEKNKVILNDINFKIEKNKITAILGHSGSGKSTLLKCINRIIEEDKNLFVEGQIKLNNTSIYDFDKDFIRKNIGMVFQNPTPFPFSIIKNITYALKFHLPKSNHNEIAITNLKKVSLYEEISKDINMSALKLSGGQKQRLCIARTLAIDPQIILLDEPCSSLDHENTLKIESLLKSLKNNYTIVIVTHNLEQANRIADNFIYLNEGTITKDRTI